MKLFYRSIIVLINVLYYSCTQNYDKTDQVFMDISATEFKLKIESVDGILLDVRTPEEISGGYIENSTHVNFYDSEFERKLSLLPKDKYIYVYCQSGARSIKTAEKLIDMGQAKVFNLKGGIRSWKAKKYPIKVSTTISASPTKTMSIEELDSILSTESIVLIDFHTDWCVPCIKMTPVIDSIKKENSDRLKVIKLDIDAHNRISDEFDITAVPAYLIYNNGKEVWRAYGKQSKENIEKHLFLNI